MTEADRRREMHGGETRRKMTEVAGEYRGKGLGGRVLLVGDSFIIFFHRIQGLSGLVLNIIHL